MKTKLITIAVLAGFTGILGWNSADAATSHKELGHRVWQQKVACQQEDGVNCFWNADSAGNGKGHSFFTVEMPGRKHMVCVIYVRKADQHWNYCS